MRDYQNHHFYSSYDDTPDLYDEDGSRIYGDKWDALVEIAGEMLSASGDALTELIAERNRLLAE